MSNLSLLLHRSLSTNTKPLAAAAAAATAATTLTSSAYSVKSLSDDLHKERDLKRLVEKFKKSSEVDRFRTKSGIYEETVRRLASAKKFNWIEEILEEQKKYSDISKEGFHSRIISLYGKSGMYDNAVKVFDEMPEWKCERTVFSFNALLGACLNSKKFDIVDGLFKELPTKLSIKPDSVSYNTLIKAFCEMNSLDSAIATLNEMEKNGIEPNLVTFNTLLNGLYVNGRFEEGEKFWSKMVEKNIVPDVRSYNARLFGLANEKRTKDAINIVEKMRALELKPDIYSYNGIIRGFVKEGKLEEAKLWYGEIQKNACAASKTTFAILVPFLCEKGDLGFASELCKEFIKKRCIVDGTIMQLVVDELVKESKVHEAEELVQLGKSNDYKRYKLKLPSNK